MSTGTDSPLRVDPSTQSACDSTSTASQARRSPLLHDEAVADHHRLAGDAAHGAVANDRTARAGQVAQRFEHALRSQLLVDRDGRDADDRKAEDGGIDAASQCSVEHGADQQKQDHRLLQDAEQRSCEGLVLRRRQAVRAVAPEAGERLLLAQNAALRIGHRRRPPGGDDLSRSVIRRC
ncbi:MAG: hypothetical protein ABI641_01030 [Caldimonas sp.]